MEQLNREENLRQSHARWVGQSSELLKAKFPILHGVALDARQCAAAVEQYVTQRWEIRAD